MNIMLIAVAIFVCLSQNRMESISQADHKTRLQMSKGESMYPDRQGQGHNQASELLAMLLAFRRSHSQRSVSGADHPTSRPMVRHTDIRPALRAVSGITRSIYRGRQARDIDLPSFPGPPQSLTSLRSFASSFLELRLQRLETERSLRRSANRSDKRQALITRDRNATGVHESLHGANGKSSLAAADRGAKGVSGGRHSRRSLSGRSKRAMNKSNTNVVADDYNLNKQPVISDEGSSYHEVTVHVLTTFPAGVVLGYLLTAVLFVARYKRCLCCTSSCENSANRLLGFTTLSPQNEAAVMKMKRTGEDMSVQKLSTAKLADVKHLQEQFERDRQHFLIYGRDQMLEEVKHLVNRPVFNDPLLSRQEWLENRLKWWLINDRLRSLKGQFTNPSVPPNQRMSTNRDRALDIDLEDFDSASQVHYSPPQTVVSYNSSGSSYSEWNESSDGRSSSTLDKIPKEGTRLN